MFFTVKENFIVSNSSFLIITNAIGTKINAANTGGGQNADGTINVTGTVLGIAQTIHSVVDFSIGSKWLGLGGAIAKVLPGVGAAFGNAQKKELRRP